MSNYRALAYHPTSGRLEVADWLDNLYGKRQYGVRFHSDGQRYPQHEARVPSAVDLFLIAQEMAEALGGLDCMITGDTVGGCARAGPHYLCGACTALAKWRDFTNAKEKTDG